MKVAINGFGRIGRLLFRMLYTDKKFEVIAINDLSSAKELAYLLKYDTNYGPFMSDVIGFKDDYILVGDKKIKVFSEKDPLLLPWDILEVDLIFECSGKFTDKDGLYKHIEAGAKKVLLSAPGKGKMKTIVYGVNDCLLTGEEEMVSAASCTTNCLAPVLNILNNEFRIEKGFITTIHASTNNQAIQDSFHKKGMVSRRGRSALVNIIPTTTGAAESINNVIPNLNGRLSAAAFRVPVAVGSVVEMTLELRKHVSVQKINNLFKKNESSFFHLTFDPIVSSDVIGTLHASIVDGSLTEIIEVDDKQLVKIVAWYDNEMGYTAQLIRTAKKMVQKNNSK